MSAVPAGYKQTDVGVIPKDWDVSCLQDVSERVGVGLATSVTKYYRQSGVPIIRNMNIKDGYFDDADMLYLCEDFAKANLSKAAKAFDVLTVRTGSNLGQTCVLPSGFDACQTFTTLITTPKKGFLDPNFLCFHMSSALGRDEMDRLQVGGGKGNLNTGDLKRYRIARPPVAEQRAIAAALSDVDALFAKLDQLIGKKRELKQAAMQQLLAGQTCLPGVSGVWELKRLGDVASVTKGSQLHSSKSSDGGHFAHLNGGITPSGYTDTANAPGATIAISEGGNSCGYVQFMSEPYWCGGHCYSVIPRAIDNAFLYHALKGHQASIMALRVGSGLPNVQKTALLNFSISVPINQQEQSAIATVLSDMDAALAALEARRDKTRALKQGMMQALLTGRIRLV